MALNVRELLVVWGFKVDTKGAKAIENRISALKKHASAAKENLSSLATAGGAVVAAVGAAAGAMFELARSTAAAADAAGEGAQRAGVGIEAYQELSFAAKDAGSGAEELETALAFLGRQMADANKGGDESRKMFRELGIEFEDGDKKLRPTEEVFKDLATRFKTLPDGGHKVALAMKLMSRGGQAMIPVLNMGRDGLESMGDKARALGLVFTEDMAEAGDRFEKEMGFTLGIVQGLKNAIGLDLIPVVQSVVVDFGKWLMANRDLIRTGAKEWIGKLREGVKQFWEIAKRVVKVVREWVAQHGGWNAVLKRAWDLVKKFAAAWAAWKVLNIAMAVAGMVKELVGMAAALGPVGLLIAALIAIGVWVNHVVQELGGWGAVWNDVQDAFGMLWDYLKGVGVQIVEFFTGVWQAVTGAFSAAVQYIRGLWDEVVGWVSSKVDLIAEKARSVASFFGLGDEEAGGAGRRSPATVTPALAAAGATSNVQIDARATLNFPQGTNPQVQSNAEAAFRRVAEEVYAKNLRRGEASR